MRCFIGLGSNLGDRRDNLERAAADLARSGDTRIERASPVVESPALVLDRRGPKRDRDYLNAVVELNWHRSAEDLLHFLKRIELEMGRVESGRWAPRIIDLDILLFGDEVVRTPQLAVPHAEIMHRSFVLTPLAFLAPSLVLPGDTETILARRRQLNFNLPLWMGILNLTPDSFSDGGECASTLEGKLLAFDDENVHVLDLGAVSTRPGARVVSLDEEQARLMPRLRSVRARYEACVFKPRLSVDTINAATAALALEEGVSMINDVSGLSDPAMVDLLRQSNCDYVLTHSLGTPADPGRVMVSRDPVADIKRWAGDKIEELLRGGVALDRVVFDPGIGFGKTARQSLHLIDHIEMFLDLPVRVLVGHSRKSCLRSRSGGDIDDVTLNTSLRLAAAGVDILRVHTADRHQSAFRARWESR